MVARVTPTPRELAKKLGVCEETVRRWIRAVKLRVVRTPGGRYRIPAAEVARLDKPELVEMP